MIFIISCLMRFPLPEKNQVESGLHEKQDLIMDTLNNAFTYEELHESLKEKPLSILKMQGIPSRKIPPSL